MKMNKWMTVKLVLSVFLAVLAFSGVCYAWPEDPIETSIGDGAPAFGDAIVDPVDVGGDAVDVYESIEPDMTVYLTSGEPVASASEKLSVEVQPAFDVVVLNPF